jgi:hypothetical protein
MTTHPDPRREAVAKAIYLEIYRGPEADAWWKTARQDRWVEIADAALSAIGPGDAERVREEAAKAIEDFFMVNSTVHPSTVRKLSAVVRAIPIHEAPGRGHIGDSPEQIAADMARWSREAAQDPHLDMPSPRPARSMMTRP